VSTTVKRKRTKTIGPCLVQFELIPDPDLPEDQHFTRLIDYGSIGDVKVTTKRTIVADKDGTPQQQTVADVTEEDASIEIELGEQSPKESQARLGAGKVSVVDAVTNESKTEYKQLTGTALEALYGRDVKNLKVYKVDQETLETDPTPVEYVLDIDFAKGTKEGSSAIRRIARGEGLGIADDEIVKCVYDWDKPAADRFAFGGENVINYYRMRIIKKTRTKSRIIMNFWTVYANGQDLLQFLKSQHSKTTVTFSALANEAMDEGEQIYETLYERT